MIGIPFTGSKRNWVKRVKSIVERYGYTNTLEPFGGSCILSANLCDSGLIGYKNAHINDYDRLFDDYGEFLDVKDYVVSECLKRGLRPVKADKKGHYQMGESGKEYLDGVALPMEERKILQGVVEGVDPKWYRLLSLGSNFCYALVPTHRTVRLCDFILFHRHLGTDRQREFLSVIERMDRDSLDWRDFLQNHESLFGEDTLIIADPPYLNTQHVQYKGGMDEAEMLELLEALKETGSDFLFFGYDSEWLKDWLDDNTLEGDFEYIKSYNTVKNINNTKNTYRTDYMCHVKGRLNGKALLRPPR